MRGNTSRGRRTGCATDNSIRELYHSCLGHMGTNRITGHEDARILPRTAVSSGVEGKAYNTPPPQKIPYEIVHLPPPPFALLSGREKEKEEDAHSYMSHIYVDLSTVRGADQGSA